MTEDYELSIRQGTNSNLALEVRHRLVPPGPAPIERPALLLDAADVQTLRRGLATADQVTRSTRVLNDWLGDRIQATMEAALRDLAEKKAAIPTAEAALNAATTPQERAVAESKLADARNAAKQLRVVFRVDPILWGSLADAPFELVKFDNSASPLVLSNMVSSFVHVLPKVGPAPATPASQAWPVRILIVRSNPPDLGSAVPEVRELRDFLVDTIGASLGHGHVSVDVLSTEFGHAATWANLRHHLNRKYDVLVYVGHGDVRPGFGGTAPVGVLQFESPDGKTHTPVTESQLAVELNNNPVPLVVLAGCLTASQVAPDVQQAVNDSLPRWIRGGQGVAQALVNSESGVQLAVGMRFRLESADAMVFLTGFFTSLFVKNPGEVEAAVREGRLELHAKADVPPSWSAPVLFRTLGSEPTFAFMRAKITQLSKPEADRLDFLQKLRETLWPALAGRAIDPGDPSFAALLDAINNVERELVTAVNRHGTLVTPARSEGRPGQLATVPVVFEGTMDLDKLEGEVTLKGEGARIESIALTDGVTALGFKLWTMDTADGDSKAFSIRAGADRTQIPRGEIMTVTVALDTTAKGLYSIAITQLAADPQQVVWPGSNVLLVPMI